MREVGCSSLIARLLAPIPEEQFFSRHWRREFAVSHGDTDRFAQLLPWSELNRILNQHRLLPDQLKLFRGGEKVSPEAYGATDAPGTPPRLSAARIENELRRGATLVLNRAHTLHEPITRLAEELEFILGAPVGVNVYVSFGETNGLPPHLDDHEVLILQVSGRKRWRLFGFSDPPGVLGVDVPDQLAWEDVLDEGDLLYIPRGCWHVAQAVDGPSLHLTISVSYPTVAEVLEWAAGKLKASEHGNISVPRDASPEERSHLLEVLRGAIDDLYGRDLIDAFFRDSDASRSALPRFSLPHAVAPLPGLEPNAPLYRLTSRRRLLIEEDGASAILVRTSNGVFKYPKIMKRLLDCLNTNYQATMPEIEETASLSSDIVRSLTSMLIRDGLIAPFVRT